MSMSSVSSSIGRKPVKRGGGMSTALSIIANDLGFSVSTSLSRNSSPATGEKGEDLIKILRELSAIQRKIADLEIELQRRKNDETSRYLTCVSEMEKKIEILSRITTILKEFIQNKDCIIARLQQPYSQDYIPVEVTNGLTGRLPPELGNLRYLQELWLEGTSFKDLFLLVELIVLLQLCME